MSMLERAVRAVRENYADDHGEEDYQRIAVAVLQAIREPDEAMISAGEPAFAFSETYDVRKELSQGFTAMIDAILQGGE